jgi:cytoskeleton protein RodZ
VSELGALLRQAREDRGISLLEAEQATHIRRVFLQALEEGRYEDLPGEVYGRGFVRNYAGFLGLDPEELLREYRRTTAHEPVYVPLILDEPLAPLRSHLLRWLLVLLIGAAVGVGLWYGYTHYWVGRGLMVQSLWPPIIGVSWESSAEPAPEPQDAAPVASETTVPTPSPTATEAATETLAGPAEPEAPPSPTPTATLLPTRTPMPTATPTPIVGLFVEAFADADTYLEVRTDGELVWIGILRASESADWRADELIQLRVGNAGGLQLTVNGRQVGSLGASGEVINVEYRFDELP